MITSTVIDAIMKRRSVRKFTDEPVGDDTIDALLESARWAPSGLNNQPWRFAVIRDRAVLEKLAATTKYGHIILASPVCVAVYFHLPSGYNRDKDLMSIGAAIENMLLAAQSLGIGAVWLGEILNRKDDVSSILGIGSDHELMAVIAMGKPAETPSSRRKKLSDLVIKTI